MGKQVFTRDTISGQVGYVPAIYLTLPGFKEHLEEVPEGTKSFVPELHKEKPVKDAENKAPDDKTNDPA